MERLTPEQRFLSHLRVSERSYGGTPCIEWTAFLNKGYGQFQLAPQKPVPAYRWAYEHYVGPVPAGLVLDHLCRFPACCNPAHLEPVTQAENIRRGRWGMHVAEQRNASHCVNGHERTPDNIYANPSGGNFCRKCLLVHKARYRARQRGASISRTEPVKCEQCNRLTWDDDARCFSHKVAS